MINGPQAGYKTVAASKEAQFKFVVNLLVVRFEHNLDNRAL